MSISTPITNLLAVQHPVILAPMDLVSDAALVRAVAEAGGFGILGGGYGDQGWRARELDRLRGIDRPFGVGFITWSMAKEEELLDITLAAQPRAVMLSFADPAPFMERIHRANAVAICQAQTVAMAKEAVAAGADVVVAQATEGGGHGATRGTMTLVPEIVDAVGARVPVLAAGGIADGRGLAAALMQGAAGAVMGTRFYATKEAAGADKAKRRIVEATGDDTLRSTVFDLSRGKQWPAMYTGRCLRNAHLERWYGREQALRERAAEQMALYAAARERGDFDVAAVIAGESSGLIHDLPSASSVVERTVREAEAALRRAGAGIVDAGAD